MRRASRASADRGRRPDQALRRARCRRQRQHAGCRRRGPRRHRTQRRRQDHAVPSDHRRRASRPPAACALPATTSRDLPAHAICQRGLSRTFQLTSLFPEMSARENAMLAAQARNPRRWQPFGGGSVFAQRAQCRRRGARAARPRRMSQTGLPASSATATSGCSRSPWPWRRSPRCCCSTSRRRASRSRRRRRPSRRWRGSWRGRASPCCWSSTTWRSCSASPTRSRSCIAAPSSPTGRRRRSRPMRGVQEAYLGGID